MFLQNKNNVGLFRLYFNKQVLYTVKPAHVVTSIMQPPVLKGHRLIVHQQRYRPSDSNTEYWADDYLRD
jgi:hypothetical protein